MSAGKPHPRSYGTFPRVLGEYVRAQRLLSLPEAVHKMTGLPARRLGLRDRGHIRVGARADLVVFDPKRIADQATYEDPHRYAIGVEHVLVNGSIVITFLVVPAPRAFVAHLRTAASGWASSPSVIFTYSRVRANVASGIQTAPSHMK